MAYIPNTDPERRAMLEAVGAVSLEELFAPIPADLRLQRPLNLPAAMGELELTAHMNRLAAANTSADGAVCFLGAGSYDHFVPSLCDFVGSRSEFSTAYTPYQPEASQGTLQAMFEYQTLVARLTGMDVSNASLYEGASAAAEAVLMALAATGRQQVVTAASVHPEYRQVLATYLANLDVQTATLPTPQGVVDPQELEAQLTPQTACVLVQHPNFFGALEPVERLAELAHRAGAVFIVAVDPISLGLLKPPGQYGADIVVAEGQSLGNPMSFGGPYLGIMACRQEFVRRMPGRLVGQTVDRHGRRCWVLTLQTREQHIRRHKATSNICTNQGLMALRAAVYLAAMGPEGLRRVASLCLQRAHYARQQLAARARLEPVFSAPTFKEFVVRVPGGQVERLLEAARQRGILAGVPLRRWYPQWQDCLLVAVTEKRTKAEIDRLVEVARMQTGKVAPAAGDRGSLGDGDQCEER
ncbi:MAG TPA: aminomethyl-transferring glycine dehydrogenase subunit GcvPA [Planctomycetes bacterium]|nr:aminomethyl-transferring glycine dehydrogenase subunit GcvPA [Planctomycetota bacterium]